MTMLDVWNVATTIVGTITSGIWRGTPIEVAYGGTGASSQTDARTNLGLVIGTNVQAYDADLTTIAALSPASGQGIGWDGTSWASHYMPVGRGVETGFTIPSSGTTPTSRNHAVTYTNVGLSASVVTVDSEPGLQLTATSGNIGYTPSAYTSMTIPTSGMVVMEQVWQSQQTLSTNYDLLRWGLTSATIAAVTETATTPARVCLLVKPDGTCYLETVDGSSRTATLISGLTWTTGTNYQCLLACNSASATIRIRAANTTTVYTATSALTLPAAASAVTGELYLDRNTGNTGGAWTALRMWRARPGI